MPGQFEKPITIRQAIQHIDDHTFLLPAIQRNFVWSPQQICSLFDSLMRHYPINTFMFWDVKSQSIKDKYRFYGFLTDYCQRFKESNDYVATKGHFKDFKAVIDGQQRLTSIYIGLKGSYAYKQPRVWWPNTRSDDVLPPRRLYLDLAKGIDGDDNEIMAQYHFRFLTDKQIALQGEETEAHWFEVGRVLSFPDVRSLDEIPDEIVLPYLKERNLENNVFARKALTRLYYLVRHEDIIHFYTEESQDIDHVLDVFIRTNSGGTPLAFSDLLMSIAVANWKGDARKDIDELVTEVRQSSEMSFSVGRDWVLKTCLMLTDADVRFRVRNFDADRVSIIQEQWPCIRSCVIEAFKLIRRLGLNDQSLRAKNAVIPLAYYLYKQTWREEPLYKSINNLNYHRDERLAIARWLHMVLLKGVFGGQSDGIISKMQRLISQNLIGKLFPVKEIVSAFTATSKDLRFDEAYLQGLLDIQYGDVRCRSVLCILFPEINENQQLHIDHLHPKSAFSKSALEKHGFLRDRADLMSVYQSPANWNSIKNLHLLNASQNKSKSDLPLMDWIAKEGTGFRVADLLIDESVSLSFDKFPEFCAARRLALLNRLRENVVISDANLVPEESVEEEDEEVDVLA